MEAEKSPCAEARRRLGEVLHGTCDELAEHRAGEHRQQREQQRGDQQLLHQVAAGAVDRARRQQRLDERDGLAAGGEHRHGSRHTRPALDALHRGVAVGERRRVQRREAFTGAAV